MRSAILLGLATLLAASAHSGRRSHDPERGEGGGAGSHESPHRRESRR